MGFGGLLIFLFLAIIITIAIIADNKSYEKKKKNFSPTFSPTSIKTKYLRQNKKENIVEFQNFKFFKEINNLLNDILQ